MTYNPEIHHRRSVRLKNYDYSQAGAYFLTLCTHNRECLFGQIQDGEMYENAYAKIVREEWVRSANIRQEIILDVFVIMPNHFHAIVSIPAVGATGRSPGNPPIFRYHRATGRSPLRPHGPKSKSIGALVAGFKSVVTKRINEIRHTPSLKIWQRNYYEHIIRNEESFCEIAEYIVNNPVKWTEDKLYVAPTGGMTMLCRGGPACPPSPHVSI
jgi:REP element-mobilizing transposase RayT